jgi:hypothetical protein
MKVSRADGSHVGDLDQTVLAAMAAQVSGSIAAIKCDRKR